MAWSTPVICEVCVGMEVTSYLSAETQEIERRPSKSGGVFNSRN